MQWVRARHRTPRLPCLECAPSKTAKDAASLSRDDAKMAEPPTIVILGRDKLDVGEVHSCKKLVRARSRERRPAMRNTLAVLIIWFVAAASAVCENVKVEPGPSLHR